MLPYVLTSSFARFSSPSGACTNAVMSVSHFAEGDSTVSTCIHTRGRRRTVSIRTNMNQRKERQLLDDGTCTKQRDNRRDRIAVLDARRLRPHALLPYNTPQKTIKNANHNDVLKRQAFSGAHNSER